MLVKVSYKGVSKFVDESNLTALSFLKERGYDIVRDSKGAIKKFPNSVLKASEKATYKGTLTDIFN